MNMKNQLYRSSTNKFIGGVAGGLAEYFDIDPIIIRVIFFVSIFAWGLSILIYIALWIIVPLKSNIEQINNNDNIENDLNNIYEELGVDAENDKTRKKIISGIVLISLGLLIMIDKYLPWVSLTNFWPIVLIAIGGYVVFKALNNK